MSPRKPAVLRDDSGQNLRDYLIETAARLIDQRGSAGLAVRDIAREAKVADGVLYNYFEDKEDLLAQALFAHVGHVMNEAPRLLPEAGTGTVVRNLAAFIDAGLAVLIRVVPAFAGLLSQPKVLARFHAMVGGDQAFGTAAPGRGPAAQTGAEDAGPPDPGDGMGDDTPRSLPDVLTRYLRAEQRLGRIDPGADIDAATQLIVGAIHGQILPRVLVTPGQPITVPPGAGTRLAAAVVRGLEPRSS
jgi:AcrR family transcriptional regulator